MKADETKKLKNKPETLDFVGFPAISSGARGGTRTPTPLLASGPKPGASTNFATRAGS